MAAKGAACRVAREANSPLHRDKTGIGTGTYFRKMLDDRVNGFGPTGRTPYQICNLLGVSIQGWLTDR
jgi:hypothetical protein